MVIFKLQDVVGILVGVLSAVTNDGQLALFESRRDRQLPLRSEEVAMTHFFVLKYEIVPRSRNCQLRSFGFKVRVLARETLAVFAATDVVLFQTIGSETGDFEVLQQLGEDESLHEMNHDMCQLLPG